jgi:hypothetical protein
MTKTVIGFLLLIMASTSFAERFQDSIHSYALGRDGEDHLLKLGSGRVAYIAPGDNYRLEDLRPGQKLELDVDERLTVRSMVSLPGLPVEFPSPELDPTDVRHEPTVLGSEAAVARIFRGMNRSWYQQTECSDRAHVWAYEEWIKHQLVSKKVFLFFTNTYIRAYRWHWWFHVAPYTLVSTENGVEDRVLDPRFLRSHVGMKRWTDVFIRSRRVCPENTYRYYRNNTNGPEHCVLVKADMYYRLPLHVRALEDQGQVKTSFNAAEVNFSYRAFSRRGVPRPRLNLE